MLMKRGIIQRTLSLLVCLALAGLLAALPARAQQPLGTFWDATVPDIVYTSGVSNDGNLIVYGGREGVVYARNAGGTELWQIDLNSTVRHLAVSGDGTRVFAATEDRNVYRLDINGVVVWNQRTRMPPVGIGTSLDGAVVVVGEERTPRLDIIDGATGEFRQQIDLEIRIETATISSDGRYAYVGSRDSRLGCYDTATGQKLWEAQLDRIPYTIAAPGDGAVVYTGGDNRKVLAVEAYTGRLLWSYQVTDRVTDITATEDSSVIAAASWDGKVYLLDKNGALIQTVEGKAEVHTASISADGEVVIAGTAAGRVFAVNLGSAQSAARARAVRRVVFTALAIALAVVGVLVLVRYLSHNPAGRAWWAPRGRALARLGRAMWKGRLGYLFILPTFILLIIFNYYPSIMGLGLGFTEWTPGQPRPPQFVGLNNYRLVLANPNTLAALRNVAIFAVTDLFKVLVGPLIIAEFIFALSKARHQYIWRTVFIIPLIVPGVASILMWSNILDPNLGLINNILFKLGLASPLNPPAWLGNPATALPALIFVGFPWIGAFPLLIYYGGLISISSDIYDAAKVDGASGLRRVFSIDIPILVPQIRLLSVLAVIGSLQQFSLVLLTTRGGPGNRTTTPVYEMYMQGINSGRYGYAAALASMLFVIIMSITLLNLRVMRDRTPIK